MREYYKMGAQQKNKKSPVPTIIGVSIALIVFLGIFYAAYKG